MNFLEFKSSTVQGKRAECPAFAITLEFRFVFILPVFHILFQRSWLTWRRLLYKWPVLVASGTWCCQWIKRNISSERTSVSPSFHSSGCHTIDAAFAMLQSKRLGHFPSLSSKKSNFVLCLGYGRDFTNGFLKLADWAYIDSDVKSA